MRLLLEKLLEGCKERGYLKVRGRARTDSTHVLGALRVLSKWERTAETMRAALNALASSYWLGREASLSAPHPAATKIVAAAIASVLRITVRASPRLSWNEDYTWPAHDNMGALPAGMEQGYRTLIIAQPTGERRWGWHSPMW